MAQPTGAPVPGIGELVRLATEATQRGDVAVAMEHSEELVTLARREGDEESQVAGLFYLYCACSNVGKQKSAFGMLEEALRIADVNGFNHWRGTLLANVALHLPASDAESRVRLYGEALQIGRDAGDIDLHICCLGRLGIVFAQMTVRISLRLPLHRAVLGDQKLAHVMEKLPPAIAKACHEEAISRAEEHHRQATASSGNPGAGSEATRLLAAALQAAGSMYCGLVLPSTHAVSAGCGLLDLDRGLAHLQRACELASTSPAVRIRMGKEAFWRLGDALAAQEHWERAADAYQSGDAAFDDQWAALADDDQRRSSRDRAGLVRWGAARQRALLRANRVKDALLAAEGCRARALAVLLGAAGPHLLEWSDVAELAQRECSAIVYYSVLDDGRCASWVISSGGELVGSAEFGAQRWGEGGAGMVRMLAVARSRLGARCRDEGEADWLGCDADLDAASEGVPCSDRGPQEVLRKRCEDRLQQLAEADGVLEELYCDFILPVAAWIKDEQHLLIVPDQQLHTLPFAAMRDEEGQYLVQRHDVRIAPSLHALQLLTAHPPPAAQCALAMGVSDFRLCLPRALTLTRSTGEDLGLSVEACNDGLLVKGVATGSPAARHNAQRPSESLLVGDCVTEVNGRVSPGDMQLELRSATELRVKAKRRLGRLPGVLEEVADVEEQCRAAGISVERLVNVEVDKATLLGRMEAAGLVIHLATHGLLDKLAFALQEELLCAGEVYRLRLSARLVVLSACNTGLGDLGADGVVGLARAFLAAGARAALVTLWSVRDKSTRAFMRHFYGHWLRGGMTVQAAARAAMCAMIDAKVTSGAYEGQREYHPVHWAPFVVVGSS